MEDGGYGVDFCVDFCVCFVEEDGAEEPGTDYVVVGHVVGMGAGVC